MKELSFKEMQNLSICKCIIFFSYSFTAKNELETQENQLAETQKM